MTNVQTASWSSPTSDIIFSLTQHSQSAPETRRGSRRQSQDPSEAGSTLDRPKSAIAARREFVATLPPPAAIKFRDPLHWASRRGPHAMGSSMRSKSLTHAQIGATAFGMPRWEQPRPDLEAKHRALMKRLHEPPPPSSPLSKWRPRTSEGGMPPRWARTQHKHGPFVRAG